MLMSVLLLTSVGDIAILWTALYLLMLAVRI